MKTVSKTFSEFIIKGKVIRGDRYGRKIGFPTINIDRRHFKRLKDKPKPGVYAGEVILKRKIYKAGIVIGPKDSKDLPKIEAHLIGYSGNAYKELVVMRLKKFLREYRLFKTEKALINQIRKDIDICKKIM